MASIAQEESRKISERVKWGIRRKMESGYVYGYSAMLGFRTENGKLTIVPEEAEIVKRIFNSYVYEGKGCHTIANELNAAGLLSVKGKMWREDGVCRILKNDKYVGDLTQWKHYSTDFLTKQVLQNNGDNPDVPLITIPDHHEGIVSRELWDLAQKQLYERGKLSREGRKYSSHYWFSSKVFCGKCGYTYNVSGRKDEEKRCMHCVNRAKYGSVHRVDANGAEVGCDNVTFNEVTLKICMKYLIEHIQVAREDIVSQLLADIQMVQQSEPASNIEPLKAEIENLSRKKRKAIDLMLDDLLSREDLKKQADFYDSEIARLTQEIADKQDVSAVHQRQLDSIKAYIRQVNLTAEHDSDDTAFYSQLLQKAVVLEVVSDDDAALLLTRQHILHIVLNVTTILNNSSVNIACSKVDDREMVLQVADYAHYLVVLPLLLEHGDKLRHAECRDIEPLAREGVKIVQTIGILLEPGIATVATHEHVGVHKDVVWVKVARLVSHGSEYQMWELLLFLFGQYVHPTGCPHANEVIYELSACQSVLLQEQFHHALALLFNLFVSFAHNYVP